IRRALESVRGQTQASVAGFLSLDPEGPVPKLILPEKAQVDVSLSRHLTQKAQQTGRIVWLAAEAGQIANAESLGAFTDAVCVPVKVGDAPLGALHVYRYNARFTDRHQRFCEVLAGYLANRLHVLRARRILEAENSRLRGHAPVVDELIGTS